MRFPSSIHFWYVFESKRQPVIGICIHKLPIFAATLNINAKVISDNINKWTLNYLWNEIISTSALLSRGIPQGTMFGPSVIQSWRIYYYAIVRNDIAEYYDSGYSLSGLFRTAHLDLWCHYKKEYVSVPSIQKRILYYYWLGLCRIHIVAVSFRCLRSTVAADTLHHYFLLRLVRHAIYWTWRKKIELLEMVL